VMVNLSRALTTGRGPQSARQAERRRPGPKDGAQPFFEAAADVARGHPPPDAMQRPSATTWLQGARERDRPTPPGKTWGVGRPMPSLRASTKEHD
jgi:hypothetical protein